MDVIILMLVCFFGYIAAYQLYGKFLSRKIFMISDQEFMPAEEFKDGNDFVPTRKGIIFGHHYTSIAGTGPIVGPAIGIIWGWVPAIIWIFVGSIIMGAVHDFGALVLSLRNQGKSISEITEKYINKRTKYIFFLIVFFALLVVIAIFGLVIAVVFLSFPSAVFPVWMQIPISVALGWIIYNHKKNVVVSTIIAVIFMYFTVMLGSVLPFTMPEVAGIPSTGVWTIVLLIYAFIASTLPVTRLLQPRDYINAWQLFVAMGLLVLGAVTAVLNADLHIVAPAFNLSACGAPPLWPFLFITIACGAISGFHALVASGTSSKQIAKGSDALFVGYGAMLMEAVLATLVIIAVSAGIGLEYVAADGRVLTGIAAWNTHYSSWQACAGLGSKINAVVIGSANMMFTLGIPKEIGVVIIGVFIASFAGTTLDSATRIQRYIVSELFSNIKIMSNKYMSTAFAVITAAILAFVAGADGKGALILWPMFGAVNQMLAALTFLILTIYLKDKGKYKFLITGIPFLFMLSITISSIVCNEFSFWAQSNWLLVFINGLAFVLAVWMVVEGVLAFFRRNGL